MNKKILFKIVYFLIAFLLVFSSTIGVGCSQPTVDNKIEASLEEGYVTPTMYIYTENNASVTSKDTYTASTITLDSYKEEHSFDDVGASIRLRGNASFHFEKKSFKIKFNEKTNLFGIGSGPAKDWVLLANHCDKTFLRNYLAFYLADKLGNLAFTPHSHFVEAYLNDEYLGLYVAHESVEEHKHRVNITVDDTVDTGFLVELDSYKDSEHVFYVRNKWYAIKSDILTKEQKEAVENYILAVDTAIVNDDVEKINELVNIDSFIDYYIVQELFKNPDVGWSSVYMWKDKGGKLNMGPVWDFDNSVGNDCRLDNSSFEDLRAGYQADYVGNDENVKDTWFKYLTKKAWFLNKVVERWTEKLGLINEMIEIADDIAMANIDAVENNYEKWKSLQKRINVEGYFIFELDTYEEHVLHLQDWLSNRVDWLNEYWGVEIEE